MFSDVIELLKNNPIVDENGFEANNENKREVFSNKKSVRASEHYEAQKIGYKLSLMFEIKPYDYEDEEYLIFDDKKYKIERTYQKNSEVLELICRREN